MDKESFSLAVKYASAPLCYNGNLNSPEDIRQLQAAFPSVEAVMLGRGLIGDPGMLSPGGTTTEALEAFHEELLESCRVYQEIYYSQFPKEVTDHER